MLCSGWSLLEILGAVHGNSTYGVRNGGSVLVVIRWRWGRYAGLVRVNRVLETVALGKKRRVCVEWVGRVVARNSRCCEFSQRRRRTCPFDRMHWLERHCNVGISKRIGELLICSERSDRQLVVKTGERVRKRIPLHIPVRTLSCRCQRRCRMSKRGWLS